ncbi:hypothetical protein HHI36_022131 [Cryptolaemus montrouzieri]|uniref:Uncharacterized protein n=1 Tax=Cryptolaemus montrouzieri TaxID=559131 RepID=A0ABD2MZL6_9CUCU
MSFTNSYLQPNDILGINIGDLHAGIDTNIFSKLKNDLEQGTKALMGSNTDTTTKVNINNLKNILGVNIGDLHAGINTNILSKLQNDLQALMGGKINTVTNTETPGKNPNDILGINIGDLHAGIDTNIFSKLKNDLERGTKALMGGNTDTTTKVNINNPKDILGVNIGDLHAGINTNILSKLQNDLQALMGGQINTVENTETPGKNPKDILSVNIGDLHAGINTNILSKLQNDIQAFMGGKINTVTNTETTDKNPKDILGVDIGDLHAGINTNILSKLQNDLQALMGGKINTVTNTKTTDKNPNEIVYINIGNLHAGIDFNIISQLISDIEEGVKVLMNGIIYFKTKANNGKPNEIIGGNIGDLNTGFNINILYKLKDCLQDSAEALKGDGNLNGKTEDKNEEEIDTNNVSSLDEIITESENTLSPEGEPEVSLSRIEETVIPTSSISSIVNHPEEEVTSSNELSVADVASSVVTNEEFSISPSDVSTIRNSLHEEKLSTNIPLDLSTEAIPLQEEVMDVSSNEDTSNSLLLEEHTIPSINRPSTENSLQQDFSSENTPLNKFSIGEVSMEEESTISIVTLLTTENPLGNEVSDTNESQEGSSISLPPKNLIEESISKISKNKLSSLLNNISSIKSLVKSDKSQPGETSKLTSNGRLISKDGNVGSFSQIISSSAGVKKAKPKSHKIVTYEVIQPRVIS